MGQVKKTILVVGPGKGHNVESKLNSLNNNTFFNVYFVGIGLDKSFIGKYQNISYTNVTRTHIAGYGFPLLNILILVLKTLWILFSKKIDLVYFLGLNGYQAAPILFFKPRRILSAYEIWSSSILDYAARNKGPLSLCSRYVFRKLDYVCQYWWNVRERFVFIFPQYESKFLMYQLSYEDTFFSDEKHVAQSDFVKRFLAGIPDDEIVCFWPRSFNSSNNHVLVLDALGVIKQETPELLEPFKMYLWVGNVNDATSYNNIKVAITRNDIEKNVQIVKHPFVPRDDVFAIEERSDFFVNIANDDILSQYVMEMICSCKPFLLSNLRTFQFLNEKYGLNIELIDNSVTIIADRITDILKKKNQLSYEELHARKEKCRQIFSRNNVKKFWCEIMYDIVKKHQGSCTN